VVDPGTEYVLALYQPADYRSRAISTTTNRMGTSYYFSHGTGNSTALSSRCRLEFQADGTRWASTWPSARDGPRIHAPPLSEDRGRLQPIYHEGSGTVVGTISMSECCSEDFLDERDATAEGRPGALPWSPSRANASTTSTPIYTMPNRQESQVPCLRNRSSVYIRDHATSNTPRWSSVACRER
jgi:hypothetical protein